jgi:NAD(P)-dependent dehydrogenase (short-subunit alcohol dehydrogenase family)
VTSPRGRLEGKRALLVGAGSGIGRAVADAFVAEGASVAVMERDAAKVAALRAAPLGAAGREIVVTEGDATSFPDTAAAVDATVEALGGIDVLATFVGVFDYYLGLGALTDEQLDAGFDEAFLVNVKSPLISVKAALPHLTAARGSVILTASSSSFGPGRGGVLYVATKFAVRGLVVALAHELAPDVRVNAVAPGGTLGTDLRGLAALEQADRSLGDVPGREEDLRARTPLRVALTAEDHAASYVFLAAQDARGITGQLLRPDGGASVG